MEKFIPMKVGSNLHSWRKVILAALILPVIMLTAGLAHCQTMPYVTLDGGIRAYLGLSWDSHLSDTPMLERAYCVKYIPVVIGDEVIFQVNAIRQADSIFATPEMISYQCPSGRGRANLHVHTPQTCSGDVCEMGGRDAYACQPSEIDQDSLDRSGDKFGLIQCDRMAVVSYWPTKRKR